MMKETWGRRSFRASLRKPPLLPCVRWSLAKFFQKTLTLGPNLIEAYYELGRAFWFNDQEAEAKESWVKGHATNKFNPWGKRCAEVLATVEAGGEPPR